jgi:hypothetical protein
MRRLSETLLQYARWTRIVAENSTASERPERLQWAERLEAMAADSVEAGARGEDTDRAGTVAQIIPWPGSAAR